MSAAAVQFKIVCLIKLDSKKKHSLDDHCLQCVRLLPPSIKANLEHNRHCQDDEQHTLKCSSLSTLQINLKYKFLINKFAQICCVEVVECFSRPTDFSSYVHHIIVTYKWQLASASQVGSISSPTTYNLKNQHRLFENYAVAFSCIDSHQTSYCASVILPGAKTHFKTLHTIILII